MQDQNFNIHNGQFLVFSLDKHNFALPVGSVERIVRIAAITPIPRAPEHVLGVIKIRGQVIPVFDIRKIFGLPSKEIQLSDKLILSKASERRISFVVDNIKGVTDRLKGEKVPADEIFTGLEKIVEGLTFFGDAMILIYNIEKIMSLENAVKIDLSAKRMKIPEPAENQVKPDQKSSAGEKVRPVPRKTRETQTARSKKTGENKRKK